jgi:hypothetical protein
MFRAHYQGFAKTQAQRAILLAFWCKHRYRIVQRSISDLKCAPNRTREWPDFRHQAKGLKVRASKPKASLFTRVVRTNPLFGARLCVPVRHNIESLNP